MIVSRSGAQQCLVRKSITDDANITQRGGDQLYIIDHRRSNAISPESLELCGHNISVVWISWPSTQRRVLLHEARVEGARGHRSSNVEAAAQYMPSGVGKTGERRLDIMLAC